MTERDKVTSYLGLAARAGRLRSGYNTCLSLLRAGKVFLLIAAEDSARGTVEKMEAKCRSAGTDFRIYGTKSELSRAAGRSGNGVFAVTDAGFAKVIREEIDRRQAEGE